MHRHWSKKDEGFRCTVNSCMTLGSSLNSVSFVSSLSNGDSNPYLERLWHRRNELVHRESPACGLVPSSSITYYFFYSYPPEMC